MRAQRIAVFVGCVTLSSAAQADVFTVVPGDDVEAAAAMLQPGDELELAGGTYTLTDRFGISLSGTEQAPITIRAKAGEVPHLNRPAADQNVIDVDLGEYLVFRGLEISGGSHGLRLIQARFVTVEGCDIHDTGDVALSANSGGDYEGLQIIHNHIHDTNDTGEGMYLGCNSDACRMFNSLIANNYVHHTNGPTVVQGDGIEIKEGSYNNIVRDNVIHDTNYPCILTYSTVGNGAPNIIERNAMWNCGDHGIQSAADAIIRNNIILGSGSDGIAMQPHQSGSPSNLTVVHNTVLHPMNDAISINDITGTVVIANNAVYAQQGNAISVNSANMAGLTVVGNVGEGAGPNLIPGSIANDFIAAHYMGAPPIDVFPKAGSALIGAADAAYPVDDDFNGTPRAGTSDVGAYVYDANGNPGWTLTDGFKDAPETGAGGGPSTAAAGATSTSGSGGSGGAANQGDGDEDGGCGCRLPASPPRGFALVLCLAALALLRLNRSGRASC